MSCLFFDILATGVTMMKPVQIFKQKFFNKGRRPPKRKSLHYAARERRFKDNALTKS